MREEEKTFTTCLALFAAFIRHHKQNPSNTRRIAKPAAVGVAVAGAMTPVEEAVADVDVVAEMATEAQAKADPQTNLRSTRSLGFRPTSTTLQRSTQSSLQPETVDSPAPH